MGKNDRSALIPLPSSGLAKISTGPRAIMDGMVTGTLAAVRQCERELATARIRIGEYEFCDTDYRQILIWAKVLKIMPDALVTELSQSKRYLNEPDDEYSFRVVNGSIVSLTWDFEKLTIPVFQWVDGMSIEAICFTRKSTASLEIRLNKLKRLDCSFTSLTELDLSGVPSLAALYCSHNKITELNLSSVPLLSVIDCSVNKLTEIDLSNVPSLSDLDCRSNMLTEINLTGVPLLSVLDCSFNKLIYLALTDVASLSILNCGANNLIELDISSVKNLKELNIERCKLTDIDLSSVPNLEKLEFSCNLFSGLDLSNVPNLTELHWLYAV